MVQTEAFQAEGAFHAAARLRLTANRFEPRPKNSPISRAENIEQSRTGDGAAAPRADERRLTEIQYRLQTEGRL
jgi:hypothetical protein